MPSGAVDLAQEPIRHLDQNAGAVAGVGLAAAGAAVLQVDQHLQAARDHAMRIAGRRRRRRTRRRTQSCSKAGS